MSLELISLSEWKKIFSDHRIRNEQSKLIAGTFITDTRKRKKQLYKIKQGGLF